MKHFIEELRRRNVLRVASLYAIGAWAILQVLIGTQEYLGIPQNLIRILIYLTLALFPVVIFMSWRYELLTDEEASSKKEVGDVPAGEQIDQKVATPMKYLLLLAPLIVGLGLVAYLSVSWLYETDKYNLKNLKKHPVAVMGFTNNTTDPSNDRLSHVIKAKLESSLEHTGQANLVIHNSRLDESSIVEYLHSEMGFSPEFEKKAGVTILINGSYYLHNNQFAVTSQLIESSTGKIIRSFEEQRSDVDQPFVAIDAMVELVIGFWLASDFPMLQGNQIQASALIEYLDAIDLWEEDYYRVIEHLQKSIKYDSNFFRAQLLLTEAYLNIDEYQRADSMYHEMKKRTHDMSSSDVNLFSYYEARLQSNRKNAYFFYKREYARAPKDLFINTAALIEAVLANDSRNAIRISKQIDNQWYNQTICHYCRDRFSLLGQALIEQRNYSEAIKLLREAKYDPVDMSLKELEIRALVRQGSTQLIHDLLREGKNQQFTYGDYGYLLRKVVYELSLINHSLTSEFTEIAMEYYNRDSTLGSQAALAELKFMNRDYKDCEQMLIEVFKKVDRKKVSQSQLLPYEIILARARGYQGKVEDVNEFIEYLENQKTPHDQGGYAYIQALIKLSLGNEQEALDLLEEAVVNGRGFYRYDFQNDHGLKKIFEDPKFKRILKYYL